MIIATAAQSLRLDPILEPRNASELERYARTIDGIAFSTARGTARMEGPSLDESTYASLGSIQVDQQYGLAIDFRCGHCGARDRQCLLGQGPPCCTRSTLLLFTQSNRVTNGWMHRQSNTRASMPRCITHYVLNPSLFMRISPFKPRIIGNILHRVEVSWKRALSSGGCTDAHPRCYHLKPRLLLSRCGRRWRFELCSRCRCRAVLSPNQRFCDFS
jgi:hypothetical protein